MEIKSEIVSIEIIRERDKEIKKDIKHLGWKFLGEPEGDDIPRCPNNDLQILFLAEHNGENFLFCDRCLEKIKYK